MGFEIRPKSKSIPSYCQILKLKVTLPFELHSSSIKKKVLYSASE